MSRIVGSALRAVYGGAPVRSRRGLSLSSALRQNVDRFSFNTLPLSEDLQQQLKKNNFETMFEIQEKSLPICLDGKDLVGRAATGSGKTLCFSLPVIEKLRRSTSSGKPRALMIFPTRELAIQVHDSVADLAPELKLCLAYGGQSFGVQREKLRNCDIVIGTPGRLGRFLAFGDLRLGGVQFLVLDEADELLRPSFYEQIHEILRATPRDKQTLLFSATFPKEARSVAESFMRNPNYIEVDSGTGAVPSSIEQIAMLMEKGREVGIIMHLLKTYKPKSCVIFVGKKRSTFLLARYLRKIGVQCNEINGDMSQSEREATLQRFRGGFIPVLVGTDVVARGMDVPNLELVVQIEPPPSGATHHTHRSGRTGRAGRPGKSVMLYYDYQERLMNEVRKNEPAMRDEPAPEPVSNPDKPWEGVLHEDFGFGGFGQREGWQGNTFGRQSDSFRGQQYGFGRQQSGFGRQQSGFGKQQYGFGRQQYGFGRQQSGFGGQQNRFNRQNNSFDNSPFHDEW